MGYFRDSADGPFGYTIFTISVNATIENTLVIIVNVLNKIICFEESVISKISIDQNYMIKARFSIVLFGLNSFWMKKPELMLNMNISTHIINKDASS